MVRPKTRKPLGSGRHCGRGWSLERAVSPGQPHAAVTPARGDSLLGCGVEGSFSPAPTSPLDHALPAWAFSAAVAKAGWMAGPSPSPMVSPGPGLFCFLGQMGLSLEQGWEVSTNRRRQISSDHLPLRSGHQGGAYGLVTYCLRVVEPTRVQAKTSFLS